MIVLRRLAVLCGLLTWACETHPPAAQHRLELRQTSGDLVEFVPREGAPPFCLLFSVSQRGVIRQLTMNEAKESFDCAAQKPVGGTAFRIPKAEGKARIYAFFSDQSLKAGSIAEQLEELAARPNFNLLDMRLPGNVVSDMVEYAP